MASASMRANAWRTRFKSPATSCSFAFLNDLPLPFDSVTQPSRSAVITYDPDFLRLPRERRMPGSCTAPLTCRSEP
jgi:hypothetical protein